MSSLLHAIEDRIHMLGGTDVEIRNQDCGSNKLLITFLHQGKPKCALMHAPKNREGRQAMVAAIQKAITV